MSRPLWSRHGGERSRDANSPRLSAGSSRQARFLLVFEGAQAFPQVGLQLLFADQPVLRPGAEACEACIDLRFLVKDSAACGLDSVGEGCEVWIELKWGSTVGSLQQALEAGLASLAQPRLGLVAIARARAGARWQLHKNLGGGTLPSPAGVGCLAVVRGAWRLWVLGVGPCAAREARVFEGSYEPPSMKPKPGQYSQAWLMAHPELDRALWMSSPARARAVQESAARGPAAPARRVQHAVAKPKQQPEKQPVFKPPVRVVKPPSLEAAAAEAKRQRASALDRPAVYAGWIAKLEKWQQQKAEHELLERGATA